MKHAYFTLFTLVLLYACGEKTTTEKNNDTTALADSAAVKPLTYPFENDLAAFVELFDSTATFPVTLDSSVLNTVTKHDSLNGNYVRVLAKQWFKHALNDETPYALTQFYTIDSVKAKGAYAEWCKGLDIGNTKYADAYALQRIQVNAETTVLVWALASSSYEACPFFRETNIYFTLVYQGKIGENLCVASALSAGDPPVFSKTYIWATLSADGKIMISYENMDDEDMDAPKVQITTAQYVFNIADGKFVLESEKKDKPKMVKREN